MKNKILFVDDQPDILETLEAQFEEKYSVFTASTGAEAIKIKKQENIHLIITDLQMPEMDGIELLTKVKAEDPFTFFIAMTGHWGFYELIRCREAGFDDYLTKPFENDVLAEAIFDGTKKVNRWLQVINKSQLNEDAI
jgi:CheY-like chemotaxis protein